MAKKDGAKLTIDTEAPKAPKSRKMPILDYIAKLDGDTEDSEGETEEGDGEGKVKRIIRLYNAGYTKSEICTPIEKGGAGFNRSTTYRQCAEFDKLRKAPALTFGTTGFQLYEARLLRMMSSKKISREEAAAIIAEKDGE